MLRAREGMEKSEMQTRGHDDASEEAAGIDAQSAGREIAVGLTEGADGREADGLGRETSGSQLKTVAAGQVDVPFFFCTCGIAAADDRHVETGCAEGVVYLLPHLEAVEADARSYLCPQLFGTRTVGTGHGRHRLLTDACHRAPPSGMNGTDGVVGLVVEQYGDAVGCRHANAHAAQVGHQGIAALQGLCPLRWREGHQVLVDLGDARLVYLMWHQQVIVADAETLAEQRTVTADVLVGIATKSVDVERGIAITETAPQTCGGERRHLRTKVVEVEHGAHHLVEHPPVGRHLLVEGQRIGSRR